MSLTYFVKIDGIAGDSTSKGHEGWFELSTVEFAQSSSANTSGGTSDLSTGATSFSDVSLGLGSDSALVRLLSTLTTSQRIGSVEIEGVTNGDSPQTVFDMTLNDVQLTSFSGADSAGGDSRFFATLDYGKIGVVTTGQLPDGSPGPQQSFGWDVLANKAIDPATLETPSSSSTSGVPDPVDYYLRIDGIAGTSTDKGHEGWIKLDSYTLAESIASALTTGGSGAGSAKPSFDDLHLSISDAAVLPALLAKIASGQHIASLEIEGVTAGDAPRTVFDLTLNTVVVSSLAAGVAAGSPANLSLAFDYGQIGLVTTTQNKDGSLGGQQSFGWDIATGKAIDPASLDTPVSTTVASVETASTYFVKIDGVTGDSTSKGHEGWFELPSFTFGGINSGSFDAISGKAIFQNIAFNLQGNGALTSLLLKVSSGMEIPAVKIEGVSGTETPHTVFDLTLNGVIVTGLTSSDRSGDTASTFVSLDYEKIGLVTTSYGDTGAISHENSFGWDLVAQKAVDPATLDAPTPDTASASFPDPVTYFLKIDGVVGDSTSKGHEGWIEISSYNLGESLATFLGSTGLESGKPTFQDLSVALGDNVALTSLLAKSVSGARIASLEIEGVTSGESPQTVFDLTLNNVGASSVSYSDADGSPSGTSLTFNFSKIGIVTTSQLANGNPGPSQSFGWDLAAAKAIDPASLSTPANSSPAAPVADADTYFIKIDGIAGDSTSKGHEGWFELSALTFGESNATALSGLSSGRVNFTDLSVALSNNTALAGLLLKATTGAQIASVEIEGVSGGLTPRTVFDLTLNKVTVTSLETSDAAGGQSQVAAKLAFGQIGLVTTGQNPNGTAAPSQAFGWDLETAKAINPSTLLTPAQSSTDGVPEPQTYFLKIDGVTGSSTSKGHEGWIEIDSYRFGETLAAVLGGSGSGVSKPVFQDLLVALQDDRALVDLLRASATGRIIPTVEIEGMSGGANPAKVFELVLGGAHIDSLGNGGFSGENGLGSQLAFSFGQIGLKTFGQDRTGNIGTVQEFGWDLATGKAIDPDSLLTPVDLVPIVAVTSQALADDTGASATDLVTKDGHVTLTGTASDDNGVASVHIFDGATDLGAALLTGGTWTFTTDLAAGAHALTAVVTDSAGQTATSAVQPQIVVDKTAPDVAVTGESLANDNGVSSADFLSNDGAFTLSGTFADSQTPVTVHVFDGATDLGAATLSAGGWSFSGTLGEGTHQLSVQAVDLAGNASTAAAAQAIVIDQTGPVVATGNQHLLIDSGVSASDGVTFDGRVVLSGTASDDRNLASVHVFDGDVDLGAATLANGAWTFSTTLAVGTHALRAVAFDSAGNRTDGVAQAPITVVAQTPIVASPTQRVVGGTAGADLIVFGPGNPIVTGGDGNDVFVLGSGRTGGFQILAGGDGVDTLDLSGLSTPVTVNLPAHLLSGAQVGPALIASIENVIGGSGADVIRASASVNAFTGGAGGDTFGFDSLNALVNGGLGNDSISDFQETALFGAAHDVIDLRGIDAILGGRDDAFTFIATPWDGTGSQFTAAGQLRAQYVVDAFGQEHTLIAGNIHRAGQGNGLAADFVIDLLGHHTLTAADFVL
jgi:type VI protein secretion system component Hcp